MSNALYGAVALSIALPLSLAFGLAPREPEDRLAATCQQFPYPWVTWPITSPVDADAAVLAHKVAEGWRTEEQAFRLVRDGLGTIVKRYPDLARVHPAGAVLLADVGWPRMPEHDGVPPQVDLPPAFAAILATCHGSVASGDRPGARHRATFPVFVDPGPLDAALRASDVNYFPQDWVREYADLSLRREGDVLLFHFWRGHGDCPSGCIGGTTDRFQVVDGVVTPLRRED